MGFVTEVLCELKNNEALPAWELNPGEELIWSGRPRQGLMLRPSDKDPQLFIIFMLSMLAIFIGIGLQTGENDLAYGGIPFLIAGVYFAVCRMILDAANRKCTYYFLTSRRVIITKTVRAKSTNVINLDLLDEIDIVNNPDGSGTIYFGPPRAVPVKARGSSQRVVYSLEERPKLDTIMNASEVHRLIARAADAAKVPVRE